MTFNGFTTRALVALVLVSSGLQIAGASSAFALQFYVDDATGSDARSPLQAQSASTPWKTISHALETVDTTSARHRIRIKPGTYAETPETAFGDIDIVADGAPGSVVVQPGSGAPALGVNHPDVLVDGLVFEGGTHGIRADNANGLVIRGCVGVGAQFNAFHVEDTTGVTIESSRAVSAGDRGILLSRVSAAYVRNNLAYDNGEWGIDLENTGGPLSTGNVLAFNTVYENGSVDGGIRLVNAVGEVRDNLIVANAPTGLRLETPGSSVHHNLIWGSTTALSPPSYPLGGGMLGADPLFVQPNGTDGVLGGIGTYADDLFAIDPSSPAVNAGSGTPAAKDISGSTRQNGAADTGVADMGFHSGASASSGVPAVSSGPATYYVNAATGNDARDRATAQSPSTPWDTLGHALSSGLSAGDTVMVAGGTYPETAVVLVSDISLVTTQGAEIVPAAGQNGIRVEAPGVLVDGFAIDGATNGAMHGVRAVNADGVTLRRLVVEGTVQNGIMVVDTEDAVLDSNVVDQAGSRGILVDDSGGAYVRNNLVTRSAEWGIHFSSNGASTATGNVVAFNTVADNGTSTGGIRFQNAVGEIRDNVVASNATVGIKVDTAPTLIHHNDVFGSATPYDTESAQPPDLWENLASDPLFVGSGDYRLMTSSPAVNTGSGAVATRDISGSAVESGAADTGTADMGHHVGASTSSGAPPMATPPPAPTPTPSPTPTPTPAGPLYYVDCATGDDDHTVEQAQNPATPWKTIRHAINQLDDVTADQVIEVASGTCVESDEVEIDEPNVTVRAAVAGGTTVTVFDPQAPTQPTVFNLTNDGITLEGFVIEAYTRGVTMPSGSGDTVQGPTLRNLEVRPASGSIQFDAILIRDAVGPIVENCRVSGASGAGILLRRVQNGYLRNNIATQNVGAGIQVDHVGAAGISAGTVVAFNTVVSNAGGGIRFSLATGEIRDNLVISNTGIAVKTDMAPTAIHHNDLFGSTTLIDQATGQAPTVWDNVTVDPSFVGDFQLPQTAAGQGTNSPVLNLGSGDVATRDISGSTRTDDVADAGIADLGYHHGAGASTGRPTPIMEPPGSGPFVYYVDTTTGNDSRSKFDARDEDTPWKTIGRALQSGAAASGDTVMVAAGTYAESASSTTSGITLLADGAVTITPPSNQIGLNINHTDFTIEGFQVVGGLHGIRATNADGLLLSECRASGQTANGIMVDDSSGVVVENNVVEDVTSRGILVRATDLAYVRNNLVVDSGDWGIHLAAHTLSVSEDNIVAFNTVYSSGGVMASGGIFFQRATGEIRDNIVAQNTTVGIKTDTAPTYIHHNVLFGNTTAFEDETGEEPELWSNLIDNPLFVNAPAGNFALGHVAAGQGANSPAIDRGSGLVDVVDISGSTRSDAVADAGTADPGYHAGAGTSSGPPDPSTDPSPEPGSGTTYYVDPVSGSNSNSNGAAQSPGTPWQTIGHAISRSSPGDILFLRPGTYAEQVSFDFDALTLRGDGALGSVVLTPPAGQVGISITGFVDARVENLVIEGGSQAIRAEAADGIRITNVVAAAQTTVGIQVIDTDLAWIDSSIITGAGSHGLLLKRASNVYVRNNLVYTNGDWGISLDNTSETNPQPAVSTGNIIAFNTVHQNENGIRLLNASGEVRDNNITGHTDLGLFSGGPNILVHHDNFATNGRDRDKDTAFSSTIFVWSLLGKSPRYVNPTGDDGIIGGLGWGDDNFRLQRLAAGEDHDSPAVDAGSGQVSALDISGTTATQGEDDSGVADIGFHYGAAPADEPPAPASPPAQVSKTYYVSPSLGNDTRSATAAQNPATPWKTIAKAIDVAIAGDAVIAREGLYVEAVTVDVDDLMLLAEIPAESMIDPPAGTAIRVTASGVTVDGFVLRTPSTGILLEAGADDVTIKNCAAIGSSTDGIRANDVSGVTIESSIATGSLFSGITLNRVTGATVRNNLSYANGEWGLNVDARPSAQIPVSTGNLVAQNTFAYNGIGGARLLNAIGEVRDNLFSDEGTGLRIDTSGALLRHNGFNATATPLDPQGYLFCADCTANEAVDPAYVDPAGSDGILGEDGWSDDDFRLSQIAAGQAIQSDAVDFGSDLVSVLGASGSTATSGSADSGFLDVGYHYDSSERALPSPGWTALPDDILYVDTNIGDDARTRSQANSPTTPWKTISRALRDVVSGDTLLVAPGIYAESIRIDVENVTVRGSGPSPAATLLQPGKRDGILVRATGIALENLWIDQPRRGIMTRPGTNGLEIEDVVITAASGDGIMLRGAASDVRIDGVSVSGSRRHGIYARSMTGLIIENADLYSNRGMGLMLSSSEAEVAFMTAFANREGVRVARSDLQLRDSVVADNVIGIRAPTGQALSISYTLIGTNLTNLRPATLPVGAGVQLGANPMLVDPDGVDGVLGGAGWQDDDLSLSQVAGGQASNSPAVNAGSALASSLGVTGSTASNGVPDTGQVDLGAHR